MNEQKLNGFLGQLMNDLGGAFGIALGAQAGEGRLREVVTNGGFRIFRRATQPPFHLVLKARA